MMAALVAVCFGLTVHDAYARMDTTALVRSYADALTREDSLLARYRLFALTRDRQWISRLPERLAGGTAREHALLSALWAWHIPGSAPWNVVRLGRRSGSLLTEALRHGGDDALVALIDGQSLLFRPGIAGGDVRGGGRRLQLLADRLRERPDCAVPVLEARVWLWYALDRAGEHERAAELRSALLDHGVPPLYAAFLGVGRDRP